MDNVEAEIRGHRNPFCISEKEWFGQEDATDRRVLCRVEGDTPILRNPVAHFRKRSNPVAFTERLPRQRDRLLDKLGEEPTADYEVARRMELK